MGDRTSNVWLRHTVVSHEMEPKVVIDYGIEFGAEFTHSRGNIEMSVSVHHKDFDKVVQSMMEADKAATLSAFMKYLKSNLK